MKRTNQTTSEKKPKNEFWKRFWIGNKISNIKSKIDKFFAKIKKKKRESQTQSLAEATKWTAYGTLALAGLNFLMWINMTCQSKETAKEFSVSHRPWVNIIDCQANGPITFDSTGLHTVVSYTIKNGGTAPAIRLIDYCIGLNVLKNADVIDCKNKYYASTIQFADVIGDGAVTSISEKPKDALGYLLLPGETHTTPVTLGDNILTIDPISETIDGNVSFTISICYADDLGNFHQTAVMWQFFPSDNNAFHTKGIVPGNSQKILITQ